MAIQQGQCTVFKKNCLSGLENFAAGTSYVYKIALYTALADLSYETLVYTTSNEITGTGYTAGGNTLTRIVPATDGQIAYISFQNVTWNPANFTARGALIYNSTTNAAVAVLDFGSNKTATNTFTVTFPTADATNAIIRLS
jgi:hypothetical protein